MPSLTKVEQAKGNVAFAVTIVALLIQRACQAAGLRDDQMPAVQQCTLLLSELLDPLSADVRGKIVRKLDGKRILLTQKTSELDILSCLVASVEVLTSTKFKSRPGTRFDFIRQTLRENLPMFQQMAATKQSDISRFRAQFEIHIFKDSK